MPTIPDLLYVALFAAVLPLWDYLVSWRSFDRKLEADPVRARMELWKSGIVYPWVLIAIGAALWIANDRSWSSFGFSVPDGWRLWVCVALVLLLIAYTVRSAVTVARDAEAQAGVREQFSGKLADVLPHTRTEMYWFAGVSVTAGFCEEFLFRGYFIWALSPWLGWWGAAALSALIFTIGHAYQGWSGVLRVAVLAVIFTLFVAIFDSLWPAIVVHALVDLNGGIISWLALRDAQISETDSRACEPSQNENGYD